MFGWHTRSAVVDRSRRAEGAARPDDGQARQRRRSPRSSPIRSSLDFAARGRRVRLRRELRACHGAGGGGAKGYPNLNDDDWLWGGKLADIEQTIRHGARAERRQDPPGQHAGVRPRRMLKANEISAVADYVRSLSGLPTREGRRSRARQEGVCRQLRRLPRPRRQGQPRTGRAQPDRQDLALRARQGNHHAGISNGRGGVMPAWGGRLDRIHHQGAHRLRPQLRRRRKVTARAPTMYARSAGASVPSLARLVAEAEVGGAPPDDDTPSMRRAGRFIRKACTARSARSNGWCWSSPSASTICCRSCAGIAGRTRRPGRADRFSRPPVLFLLHRDLAAGSLLPHRPADSRRRSCCS